MWSPLGEWADSSLPLVSALPDAPAAPGMPDVTEVGGDFVSLTWDKPKSDGGGKLLGYYVERKDPAGDNWTRCNNTPCASNIYNIAGLIEDREYEFRVFAVNEAGESKPSTNTRKVKVKDPQGQIQRLGNFLWVCGDKLL